MDEKNQTESTSNNRSAPDEAFELLALRYLDGMHNEEDARRLNEQLASGFEKRDLFAALSVETGMLSEMSLTTRPCESGIETSSGESRRSGAPIAAPPITSSEEGVYSPPSGYALFGLPRIFSLGIAACALMIVVAAGLWWWSSASDPANRQPLVSAKWVESGAPRVASVQLGSGTTTLELENIGSVVVEGPADFRLIGPMRARLNRGRIKVHVTQASGRGFVVETPDGEVTDLGSREK